MSSPQADKEIRLGASQICPSSGVPFLEKELPKAGSTATPGKQAQSLQLPKTWGLVLSLPICCATLCESLAHLRDFNILIYKRRGFG